MIRSLPLLCLLLAASAPALAVEFRWALGTGMAGTVVASVQNADGSNFRISCEAGDSREPSIEYEPARLKLDKTERVQIVIGEETFPFDFEPYSDSSFAALSARGARGDMARMVRTLMAARAPSLSVEVPRRNLSETFSLKDAGKALRSRKGGAITDPCL